ncbi:MAG: DUF4190 domain-containing protein [Deltaproteobacteria bacterium]|nr:DUF4190 domain-containing protein [Deltaproteobacteria bacterium]
MDSELTDTPTSHGSAPTPPTAAGISGRAMAALVLGLLALIPCCLFFTGIPAIIVGQLELAAIDNGAAPTAGRAIAKTGLVFGVIGSALGLLLVLGWFFAVGLGFMAKMVH